MRNRRLPRTDREWDMADGDRGPSPAEQWDEFTSTSCRCGARIDIGEVECEACEASTWIDAVDRNAARIEGYRGEYGVPAGPDEDDV